MGDVTFTDFRRAVRTGDREALDVLWLELLEQRPIPVDLALQVLEQMTSHELPSQALEFMEMLEVELMDGGRFEDAGAVMMFHAPLEAGDEQLKERYAECMRSLYRERGPRIEECILVAGITGREPLTVTAERLERLTAFVPGDVVRHGSWGAGEVKQLDPRNETVVVDFPGRPHHRFALDLALRVLTRVKAGGFDAQFARGPEKLSQQARDDPAAVVKLLLESNAGGMELREMREKLTRTIMKPQEWSSWWQKARRALVQDLFVELSGASNPLLRIRGEAVDPIRSATEKGMREPRPAERIDLVRRLFGRVTNARLYPESAAELVRKLLAWAEESKETRPGAAFCAVALARQVAGKAKVEFPGGGPELPPPQDANGAASWLADMHVSTQVEQFIEWLRSQAPALAESLPPVALRCGPDVARDVALKRLRAMAPARLAGIIEDIIENAERLLPAFLWVCAQALKGRIELAAGTSFTLLYEKVLVAANRLNAGGLALGDETRSGLSSTATALMLDKRFITRALEQASAEECDMLRSRAGELRYVDDSVLAALQHHLAEVRPEIVKVEARQREAATAILTGPAGLARRKQELDRIVREEIPRNRRELGEAASFGDLSENAEFDAARAEQIMLMKKAATIQKELKRARVPKPDEIDPTRVGFGTRVQAIRVGGDGHERVTYEILGPWESDTARGIISYGAPLARGLQGAKAGEEREVRLNDRTLRYRIEKVELSPVFASESHQ